MKYLLSFLVLGFLFAGCSKEEDYLASDIETIQGYLKANNLTAQSTSSGLHYIIEAPGVGGNPTINSQVIVNYKGYLLDGTVFDASTAPITFGLNQVIVGWQEGIPLFKKGGKGLLFIPSPLAYGSRGTGNIPPNTPLIFEIDLINFN